MQSQTELVFDPFRLDATNERLLRDGKEIRLTPKAFALLRYLAEHRREKWGFEIRTWRNMIQAALR